MGQSEGNSGKPVRVDKCLYRLSSTGMYYAVIRHEGKIFRRSLETTTRSVANRKLEDQRRRITAVDRKAGKFTLASLCDEHLETLRNAPRTLAEKKSMVGRSISIRYFR